MIGRRIPHAALALVLLALAQPAAASTYVDREIRFTPDQVKFELRDGKTRLVAPGAAHEERAGRPDIPWLGQAFAVPDGQKVTAVEVICIETSPMATGVKIEAAPRAVAGSFQIE